MDFLVGGAMVVIIMLCIGFGWSDIAVLGFTVVGALIVLIGVFFAACLVMPVSYTHLTLPTTY